MGCTTCVPTLDLGKNCKIKPIGGFEQTLYYIPMCQLAQDPFTEGYTPGLVTDIATLNGAVFKAVAVVKDSVKLTYATDPVSRMVVPTLVFDIQPLGSDTDRTLAAVEGRDFIQGMIDNNEPICWILEKRKNSRNIPERIIIPSLDPEPFAGDGGMKSEDMPKVTMTFKKSLDELAFILDPSATIPV